MAVPHGWGYDPYARAVPLISGDEFDTFSRWRQVIGGHRKPWRKTKRRYNKRLRWTVKQGLKQEERDHE